MTLQECYEKLGADYDGVLQRMAGKEALVLKFAMKFMKDSSFKELTESMDKGDYETAFRASHTLKGVASNLGFTKVFETGSELTEELRGGNKPKDENSFLNLKRAYEETITALKEVEQ